MALKNRESTRAPFAYPYMDEAVPHLYINLIPYTTENKRGLEIRVSLKKAMEQFGF